MKKITVPLFVFVLSFNTWASQLFIPMNETQKNHLKAYGLVFWILNSQELEVSWLLNYEGGSFMCPKKLAIENELIIRGITYQVISDSEVAQIESKLKAPEVNMDIVKLNKAPKVAVYSPKTKQPWDDAVTLVLTYAEIPYEVVYDDEIMQNDLPKYDWLHLHHEDFTGQWGKFYQYANQPWYKAQVEEGEVIAKKYGFSKASQLKWEVTKKVKDFVIGGGYMFAMCNATDTFDIALSADGCDIVDAFYDGDGIDTHCLEYLRFDKTFAFKDFSIITSPHTVEYSDIDSSPTFLGREVSENKDFFELFQFSAKWDAIPTMLTQNHETTIKGFLGQTTAFKKQVLKPEVVILAESKILNEARYIHAPYGKGFWSFYGGHDPEDYQHFVGEEPTDLNLHPNSAGYRLILNNILFPAAKKKKMKT